VRASLQGGSTKLARLRPSHCVSGDSGTQLRSHLCAFLAVGIRPRAENGHAVAAVFCFVAASGTGRGTSLAVALNLAVALHLVKEQGRGRQGIPKFFSGVFHCSGVKCRSSAPISTGAVKEVHTLRDLKPFNLSIFKGNKVDSNRSCCQVLGSLSFVSIGSLLTDLALSKRKLQNVAFSCHFNRRPQHTTLHVKVYQNVKKPNVDVLVFAIFELLK